MDTKFPKLDKKFINWSTFFHAGTEWLEIFEILDKETNKQYGFISFYAYPYILYFSLELFVKSLAKYEDCTFDAKKDGFLHSVTDIFVKYKDIPFFFEIIQNHKLFNLIKEYEKTLNTRFGETAVQINGLDTKLVLETVYKLRGEICKKTGLR